MCHWHQVWRNLREWTSQRTALLGALNTPAARKSRIVPPRPPRTEWRGKGRWWRIRPLRRHCLQRAARRRSAVGSSGSLMTTTRRRGRVLLGPEAAQSSRCRAITGDRVPSDPPAPHTEPTRLGATEAAAATGRTRRRVFTATHRRSDL